MGVVSKLPKTEQIVIMIEKNPNMVAASFTLPEGTIADVQTREDGRKPGRPYAMDRRQVLHGQEGSQVTLGDTADPATRSRREH